MPRPIYLTNTLTRAKEELKPLKADSVGVYSCGPTVYWFQHIGNMRAAFCWDILVRSLLRLGYPVKHVMNFTDVGHLKSDADDGEDKMIIAMRREGKSPWDIAKFYGDAYMADRAEMNMRVPDVVCPATQHVPEMIEMIKKLEANGFAYKAEGNVYYDTSRYSRYNQLRGNRHASAEYARVEGDERKRNAEDFVLWFGDSKHGDQAMQWDSPWGRGFPGWHIECSAMASKYLGEQFDIHFGGQEHIAIHHTNEIAQAEGCFCHHLKNNTHWVQIWMHNAWLMNAKGEKMSKSEGEMATLADVKAKGFSPLALRLFFFNAQYSTPQNFSWEALQASQNAYNGLLEKLQEWESVPADENLGERALELKEKFDTALADDLNTPVALATLWEAVKDGSLPVGQKKALLKDFDNVLSLGLSSVKKGGLNPEEQALLDARAAARLAKDFKKSDELRDKLAAIGVVVKDSKDGQTWTRAGRP